MSIIDDKNSYDYDFNFALEILGRWLKERQLYSRRGSRGGKNKQQPLADSVQGNDYNSAKSILIKYGKVVPLSGVLKDG